MNGSRMIEESKIIELNFKTNYKAREEVAIALLHLGYSVMFQEQGDYSYEN